ncbi:MAG: T9SS type A sorting domain-containing protein [Crocinitomicaceae bacterium]|nr:T9SS type A sorting domain-containing protein [Crocinitomicaceae bacterium]
MKKSILTIFGVFICASYFSQGISLGESSQNLKLLPITIKKDLNSIDSSFIYFVDTLALPFFDDFSSNKFQEYAPDYSAPGISSQVYYRLKDASTNAIISSNASYTNQVTFRRTYNATTSTTFDVPFSDTLLKVGNLLSYPVVYNTLSLYPPFYIYDTIGIPDVSDTIWISNPAYFQDSARQFFLPISDSSKIWLDHYAYHNYRFGVNPRSLGVVTFDGLNEQGYPYQIGTSVTNYGDKLTSKPINLGSFSASDSVYFSFLYQPQGLGDVPENGDSLLLEFYAPELSQWFHIWSVSGGATIPFKAVHVNVNDTKFFKPGFQFRFRNYGGLSGALDHFHVDYVHLRSLSAYNDTTFKDFAFSNPINTLLKTYTSVPWDHYKASIGSKMTDSLFVNLYNGSTSAENYQNGQLTINQSNLQQGLYVLPGFLLAEGQINYNPLSFLDSYHDLSVGYEYSKVLPGISQEFDVVGTASAQFPNLYQNDSTSFKQLFSNYYSYDDGSAEAAFGPTGTQARLAIRFDTYEPDSLIGVNLSFLPSVVDVSQKLFLITVWDNDNGQPGNVLYEDDAFSPRQPSYVNGNNNYQSYYFADTVKVAVGTTFFVGWRQLDPDRLNLGLDRNIDNHSTIRYSVDGGNNWYTAPFSGSAMLRPIFSTLIDATLQTNEMEEKELTIYPNPSNGKLTVEFQNGNQAPIFVYNQLGQLMMSSDSNQLDLSLINAGVYFISSPNYSTKVYKVIKL